MNVKLNPFGANNSMLQISASLLAADYARLGDEISRAELAGVDSFHFDMMDGHYVPNLALTPQHLKALRRYTSLPFHVHLELEDPDSLLTNFNPLGADLVVVQWDTLVDPSNTFDLIRRQGARVGLSVNPTDPLKEASEFLDRLDMFLVLGVQPGFGGQRMASNTTTRIQEIRKRVDDGGYNVIIAVDGGVNANTIPALLAAGADCLIMGTAIFQAESLKDFIMEVKCGMRIVPSTDGQSIIR